MRLAAATVRTVVLIVVALFAVVTVLGFAGRLWWPFELPSFFRPQEAAVLLAAGLVALALRLFRTAAVAALLAAVNAAVVLAPTWDRPSYAAPDGRSVKLLLLNVYEGNDDYARVAALIRREQADVVGLSELTPAWVMALAPALAEYRSRAVSSAGGATGIGLYGRDLLRSARIDPFAGGASPAAVGSLDLGDRTMTLVLAHPPFPFTPGNASRRSRQLDAIADAIVDGRLRAPVAVCGDLNAPPWSAAGRRFAARADLTDTSRGYRLQGTWPSFLPEPLRIPLDGCMIGDGVTLVSRRTGPDVGSDHLPLVVELAAARPDE
jgi:endonuclease/exonuclease/phosphatase (EEP) superfamily protein YafD